MRSSVSYETENEADKCVLKSMRPGNCKCLAGMSYNGTRKWGGRLSVRYDVKNASQNQTHPRYEPV